MDLINQKGRELVVGNELRQVFHESELPNVTYYAFDFHRHCGKLNFDNLEILRRELRPFITQFGCVDSNT